MASLSIGISSGIYRWNDGSLENNYFTDPRYHHNDENLSAVNNMFTARDLSRGLEFIVSGGENYRGRYPSEVFAALEATRNILSIPVSDYRSPIESVLPGSDGYGKDGLLVPEDAGIYAFSEAYVIPQTDGGSITVSFLSLEEGLPTVRSILGNLLTQINNYEFARRSDDQGVFYSNENNTERLNYDGFNYGYVIPQNISIYTQPNVNSAQISNDYRSYMSLPNSYLMRGALIRFTPVDSQWAEIVLDDLQDGEYDGRGGEVFVRIDDLQVENLSEISEPIGFINPEESENGKFIVVNIENREIILFEGTTPILRAPIVINSQETETGIFSIGRRYLSRDMPHYPGVPFSLFYDGPRAIHGSPWQHWSETVTEGVEDRRSSGNCINVPNWMIQVGEYNIPVDEFIFRWSGGLEDAENEIVGYQTQAVSVYVASDSENLSRYFQLPYQISGQTSWESLLGAASDILLNVPSSYFSEDGASELELTNTIDGQEIWNSFSSGDVLYARVINESARMFEQPDFNSAEISNPIIANGENLSTVVDERRLLPVGGVIRVEFIDDDWVMLEVDQGQLHPYGNRTQDVYIPVSDLIPENLESVSVNENLNNNERQIVVITGEHPELLLLERNSIVMRVPVFIGSNNESMETPDGEFRISRARVSSDMPGFPATGFALYFENTTGLAIHDGYSFDWSEVENGGTGSAGCVNVPNLLWRSFNFRGQSFSPSSFIFRWATNNFGEHNFNSDPEYYVPPNEINSDNTVRVIIVDDIEYLRNYSTPSDGVLWDSIIRSYYSFSNDEWIFPHS